MRKSYYDIGWLQTEDGRIAGVSLGYDRCGEHEWGIDGILGCLGVNLPDVPLGVGDRQVTEVPAELHFVEYKAKPRDKRRKAYDAAFLVLNNSYYGSDEQSGLDLLSKEAVFFTDPTSENSRPMDDLSAAWSRDSFCLNVRGAENIARLRALHAAFLRKDISIALPWANAFFRGGLSFAIPSVMTDEEKQSVLDKDLAHKKLVDAANATGIYDLLKAAGKRWYALGPGWLDSETQTEVAFFLNPCEQKRYNFGWFTVDELKDWALDKGPVVMHAELEAFAKQPENRDWSYRLIKGLGEKGIHLRFGGRLMWFDEAGKVPGIKVLVHQKSTPGLLESGIHRFDDLMGRFASPLETQSVVSVGKVVSA